jgi:hypothetical protein
MVGAAVVSERIQKGLMNGQRAELVKTFGLEPDEIAEVMRIQVSTAADFYAAVERILHARHPDSWIARLIQSGGGSAERPVVGTPS